MTQRPEDMRIFVLGDSHARALLSETHGVARLPGAFIAGGRKVNATRFHDLGDGDVSFRNPDAEAAYRWALTAVGRSRLADLTVPILCLFGMNLHYLSRAEVWDGFAVSPAMPGQFLSRAMVRATYRAQTAAALAFYSDLVTLGRPVFCTLPPRMTDGLAPPTRADVFRVLEDIASEEIAATGVRIIDHRPWSIGPDDRLRAEYGDPDQVHGSLAFGRRLIDEILAAVGSL